MRLELVSVCKGLFKYQAFIVSFSVGIHLKGR